MCVLDTNDRPIVEHAIPQYLTRTIYGRAKTVAKDVLNLGKAVSRLYFF